MSVVSSGVHNPKHYTEGRKYQPWDVAKDWDLNFDLGSVLKYIGRCGRKAGESKLKDLEKAAEFLAHEIEAEKEIQKAKDFNAEAHPNCRCTMHDMKEAEVSHTELKHHDGMMVHIVAPKDMPKELVMKIAEQEIEKILGDDRK